MHKSDRQLTNFAEILQIIEQCDVFRLAMIADDRPYIVPLNFGYHAQDDVLTFYFHCAKEGRKLDILRQNPSVCFELDCNHKLVTGRVPCLYSYLYQSVIGAGTAQELTDPQEKAEGLAHIMRRLTGRDFTIAPKQANAASVWRITVSELTAKAHTK